jgi:hypothetical protein
MHPRRRLALDRSHEIRELLRRLDAEEEVGVVRDAADLDRRRAERPRDSSEVRVKPVPPFGVDERAALLGGEDDVHIEAVVGRSHRSLRGAGHCGMPTTMRIDPRSFEARELRGFAGERRGKEILPSKRDAKCLFSRWRSSGLARG